MKHRRPVILIAMFSALGVFLVISNTSVGWRAILNRSHLSLDELSRDYHPKFNLSDESISLSVTNPGGLNVNNIRVHDEGGKLIISGYRSSSGEPERKVIEVPISGVPTKVLWLNPDGSLSEVTDLLDEIPN